MKDKSKDEKVTKKTGSDKINLDEVKFKIQSGLSSLKKKLDESMGKLTEKATEWGENVRVFIEERQINEKVTQEKKVSVSYNGKKKVDKKRSVKTTGKKEEVRIAFCASCGTELGEELAKKLFSGKPVICESCGVMMKLNKRF